MRYLLKTALAVTALSASVSISFAAPLIDNSCQGISCNTDDSTNQTMHSDNDNDNDNVNANTNVNANANSATGGNAYVGPITSVNANSNGGNTLKNDNSHSGNSTNVIVTDVDNKLSNRSDVDVSSKNYNSNKQTQGQGQDQGQGQGQALNYTNINPRQPVATAIAPSAIGNCQSMIGAAGQGIDGAGSGIIPISRNWCRTINEANWLKDNLGVATATRFMCEQSDAMAEAIGDARCNATEQLGNSNVPVSTSKPIASYEPMQPVQN